jgi:hypothetical protein
MERFAVIIILLSCLANQWAQAQDIIVPTPHLHQTGQPPTYFQPSEFSSNRGTSVARQPGCADVVEGCAPVQPVRSRHIFGRPYGVYGGYEFGWLQPRFSENVSVVVQRPSGNEARAFDHSFELSSRVWVGIENARCNGFRAGYWNLDTEAPTQVTFATATASPLSLTMIGAGGNLSRTATAILGDAMTSNHHLEMRTIDIEGTHRIRFSRTEVLGAFGLRYAKMHQRAHAVATDGTGTLTELVCQDVDFEGFGPTLAVDTTRRLFANHPFLCRLSCYTKARGSIVMGTQLQEIVLVTGGGATLAEDAHRQDDFLPIAEIAGGLQWAAQPLGPGLWTVRTGYRAESWFGTGGPVDADGNLGLHGMLLSIAANW